MIKKSLERQHKKAAEKDGASAEVFARTLFCLFESLKRWV
jgi:hypothetical protein